MTKDEAIQFYGGVAPLASALKVKRQAIYQWIDVPELRQLQLEKLTGGALRASSVDPEKSAA